MKNILKWSWGKIRKNLQVETCQSITAYLFYVREGWAIASCVHIWEFSFFLKICSVLQMLMFIFSIWGPLAILKLDIWLNALNHFRMLHLFFYPGVNTWIGLALVQKFRTYRAVNFKNIWAFFMHVYVRVWTAGSPALFEFDEKNLTWIVMKVCTDPGKSAVYKAGDRRNLLSR